MRRTPKPLGDETEHYWLAQRMARATGTDLVGAMAENDLTQEDWAAMVQACRGCQWTCGCKDWLDSPSAPAARPVPVTCVNHKRFEALHANHRRPE